MNGGDNHNHYEDVKLKPNTPTTMFTSKLHPHTLSPLHLHHHSLLHHHHQQQQQQQHHHQQQQQLSRECHNNSEEDDSRSSGGAIGGAVVEYGQSSGGGRVGPVSKKSKTTEAHSGGGGGGTGSGGGGGGGGGDGASIEVARRPRGRPPGSKNKPKPPIIITRDTESAMRPYLLHVKAGHDVIESLTCYAGRRNLGLSVMSANGTVVNVSLRQPSNATVTFHGRFEIISVSFTCLPPSQTYATSFCNVFTISLSGPQGQIFGGAVTGALIAASDVTVLATIFAAPVYVRLPEEEQGGTNTTSEDHDSQVEPPQQSSAMESPAESGAMTMYHLPSDVIWTPTARPPQQHF